VVRGEDGEVGLREGMDKIICLKIPLERAPCGLGGVVE